MNRCSIRLAIIIQGAVAIILSLGLLYSFVDEGAWAVRVDFGVLYSAARLLREAPTQLYNPDRQAEMQHRVADRPADPSTLLPFAYPAITAIPVVPLTLLGHRHAYFVAVLANLVLYSVSLWLLAHRLVLTRAKSEMLVFCALSFLP